MKQLITTKWHPEYEDLLVMAGGKPVCSVYPGWDQEEHEIIMRLIAKAPEMLEVIRIAQFALKCGPNLPVAATTSHRVADKLDRMMGEIFGDDAN